MIDVITKATFIYFNTPDDQGLTRNMLRKLYDFSTEKKYSFKYDEERIRYYIWVNNVILGEAEVSEVINNIKGICSGIDIQTDVDTIDFNIEEVVNGCSFEVLPVDSDKNRKLTDKEIDDLLSTVSDGEYDRNADNDTDRSSRPFSILNDREIDSLLKSLSGEEPL